MLSKYNQDNLRQIRTTTNKTATTTIQPTTFAATTSTTKSNNNNIYNYNNNKRRLVRCMLLSMGIVVAFGIGLTVILLFVVAGHPTSSTDLIRILMGSALTTPSAYGRKKASTKLATAVTVHSNNKMSTNDPIISSPSSYNNNYDRDVILERMNGALWSYYAGDALSAPTHWFYGGFKQIQSYYGPRGITEYTKPTYRVVVEQQQPGCRHLVVQQQLVQCCHRRSLGMLSIMGNRGCGIRTREYITMPH
jgi:hypothetical protein